jgi:hypothetical protein
MSEQAFLEKQRGLIWLLVSDTDRRLIANSPLTTSTSLPAVSRPSTSGRPTKKPDSGLPPMPCAILRRPTSPASTSWRESHSTKPHMHAKRCTQAGRFSVSSFVPMAPGCAWSSADGTDYATEVDRVVFLLVGLASDLRETSGRVPYCFDTIAGRQKIHGLNRRQIGHHVSFEYAAELAVTFVDLHQEAIRNIALALHDARELDHFAVALFGRCTR